MTANPRYTAVTCTYVRMAPRSLARVFRAGEYVCVCVCVCVRRCTCGAVTSAGTPIPCSCCCYTCRRLFYYREARSAIVIIRIPVSVHFAEIRVSAGVTPCFEAHKLLFDLSQVPA